MKTKDQIRPGDAVEVELVHRPGPLSPVVRGVHDAPPECPPIWEWVPATVVHVGREEVGVAFSDGERLAIPRRARWWRPA